MSFGSAAASIDPRFARISDDERCPCGSSAVFGSCCAPFHRGAAADSPEQLMRSRYSAFVVGNARYLSETWHPRTRPDDLTLDPDQEWEGLEVLASSHDGADAGTVVFRARWRHGRAHGLLRETSRFVRARERWYYLDGDVDDGGLEGE